MTGITAATEVQVLQGDGSNVPLLITVTGTEPEPDRLASLERRMRLLEERVDQMHSRGPAA